MMSFSSQAGGSTRQNRPGLFRRALRRLSTPGEAEDRSRAEAEAGATPIGQCADRDRVDLCGDIASVEVGSKGSKPTLVVELKDSSGAVSLVWLGRREIPGLEPGRRIRVSGRISCQPGGRRIVFNPWYELC